MLLINKSVKNACKDAPKVKEGEEDTPHIFCGYIENGRWLFFDPTSPLTIANNTEIALELKKGFYRRDYQTDSFQKPTIYHLDVLKQTYILENEKLWK